METGLPVRASGYATHLKHWRAIGCGTRATCFPLIILDLPTLWCHVEMGAIAFVLMEGKEYAELFFLSGSYLGKQISASARSGSSLKRKKYQNLRPTENLIRDQSKDVVDISALPLHMHAACTHRKKSRELALDR